jgi:hypothetical protein
MLTRKCAMLARQWEEFVPAAEMEDAADTN